jgi:hypothetical protein
MQEGAEQLEVATAVGSVEVPGDIGHRADSERQRPVLCVFGRGFRLVVWADAVATEKADDVLAGRLAGNPDAVS